MSGKDLELSTLKQGELPDELSKRVTELTKQRREVQAKIKQLPAEWGSTSPSSGPSSPTN
ncbi:hypothetical protein Pla175_43310 [Pirellulimonas nuda]|uniref:Uncharacterized protein n=1 Tax=Pirellulimonas nuda TaxID=2528009 RepID=A0A518DHG5_9BACT|nr:hypothetical protein [Pirellulimonas nuda]QDU90918.1 hypothetical protein Pla175_43310 [Pirellulimonas nuda]